MLPMAVSAQQPASKTEQTLKIVSSLSVVGTSIWDYKASERAIMEGRGMEFNPIVRQHNGQVSLGKKLALTGIQQGASFYLYKKGHRKMAIIADFACAALFATLAMRANSSGRR